LFAQKRKGTASKKKEVRPQKFSSSRMGRGPRWYFPSEFERSGKAMGKPLY